MSYGEECKKERVIVLLDVDSFELQVRGQAKGIPIEVLLSTPFVVRHENLFNCVNSPAKARGIIRGPAPYDFNPPGLCILETPVKYGKPESLSIRKAGDKLYETIVEKLVKLRNERVSCFGVPWFWCCGSPNDKYEPVVQKENSDEFYVDLTELVHQFKAIGHLSSNVYKNWDRNRTLKLYLPDRTVERTANSCNGSMKRYADTVYLPSLQIREIVALCIGQEIVNDILEEIKQSVGFVLSAGVGGNKLMAKLACNLSKPNGIAVLPSFSFGRAELEIPFTKIPGLGGDAGQELQQRYPFMRNIKQFRDDFFHRKLHRFFDNSEKSQLILMRCNGQDPGKVVRKQLPTKLSCGISLNTCGWNRTWQYHQFMFHLRSRFLEMKDNLEYDYHHHGRLPTQLKLEILENDNGNRRTVFRDTYQFYGRDAAEDALRMMTQLKGLEGWGRIYPWFLNRIGVDGRHIRRLKRINLIVWFDNGSQSSSASVYSDDSSW